MAEASAGRSVEAEEEEERERKYGERLEETRPGYDTAKTTVVVTEAAVASPNGGAGSSSSGLAARQTQPLEL